MMEAKIGNVVVASGPNLPASHLEAFGGVRSGRPAGIVVLRGTLDGREALISVSTQEAIELANALTLAAGVSMGIQAAAVELAPQGDGSSALRVVKH